MSSDSIISRRIANRKNPPAEYIVFDTDQLVTMMVRNPHLTVADNLRLAIWWELVANEYSIEHILIADEEYNIDYHARRCAIDIKRSVLDRKELPEDVSFVIKRGD